MFGFLFFVEFLDRTPNVNNERRRRIEEQLASEQSTKEAELLQTQKEAETLKG